MSVGRRRAWVYEFTMILHFALWYAASPTSAIRPESDGKRGELRVSLVAKVLI